MSKAKQISSERIAYWCTGCKAQHYVAGNAANNVTNGWTFNGDYEKPTFSPSVLSANNGHYVKGPWVKLPRCHSFVKEGKIQYLVDCGHELAGQTIEMEDLDGHNN